MLGTVNESVTTEVFSWSNSFLSSVPLPLLATKKFLLFLLRRLSSF